MYHLTILFDGTIFISLRDSGLMPHKLNWRGCQKFCSRYAFNVVTVEVYGVSGFLYERW